MPYVTDYRLSLFALPEPQRRISDIAGQLSQGKSVIWFFPENVEAESYCQAVLSLCESNSMQCKWINIYDWQDETECSLPLDILEEALSTRKNSKIRTINELLSDSLPEISLLSGIHNLEKQKQEVWCQTINLWANECKKIQAISHYSYPPALLIPLKSSGLLDCIVSDAFLSVEWFWGWYSQVELRLMARSICIEGGLKVDESLWVQYVYVELAGQDPILLEWLIENASINMTPEETFNCLREYGQNLGWNEEILSKQLDIQYSGRMGNRNGLALMPSYDLAMPWQKGIVNYSHEDGILFNSAALAIINHNDAIEHRLWTGQARLLLPLLDEARRKCCLFLIQQFREWPKYCKENGSDIYNSDIELAASGIAEFLTIENFLRSHVRKHQKAQKIAQCIRELRLKRNKLAHYRALSGDEFAYVLSQVEILKGILSR